MKRTTGLFAILAISQMSLGAVPCQNQDFVSVTGPVVIQTVGRSYSPRCVKVKAGTQVTIQASPHHPLSAMNEFNHTPNPFHSVTGELPSDQTRELTAPGVIGFFCTAHGDISGNGMAGMILVE